MLHESMGVSSFICLPGAVGLPVLVDDLKNVVADPYDITTMRKSAHFDGSTEGERFP